MNKYKQEGYDAFINDIDYSMNPYYKGSMAEEEWNIGWSLAEDDKIYHDNTTEKDDYAEE